MNKHLVFQFSSIKNTENFLRIKKIFNELDIKYEDSKNYSKNGTHLIVDQIESTEKILCYIAAGKWILRLSFVKDSLHAKKWLNEKNYHVSIKYPHSKLANVAMKWKESIDKKKLWPFLNWNVLCLIEDEKCDAILRIIEAGHGKASKFDSKKQTVLQKNHSYTIMIYNEETRTIAQEFSRELKIPCYPYQAIPDYLMQAQYNKVPLLSVSYYAENDLMLEDDNNKENNEDLNETLKVNTSFLSSYESLLMYAHVDNDDTKFVDNEFAMNFITMFDNNSYLEALDLLSTLKPNEIPTLAQLECLINFIINFNDKKKQNFTNKTNISETMSFLYSRIISYLLNLFLNNPPISLELKKLYKNLFQKIDFKLLSQFFDSPEIYIVIDILYILSVHDYLVLNLNGSEVKFKNCAILYCRIDNSLLNTVFKKLSDSPKATVTSFHKLFQIISLKNQYFKSDETIEQLSSYIRNLIKNTNSHKHIENFFVEARL